MIARGLQFTGTQSEDGGTQQMGSNCFPTRQKRVWWNLFKKTHKCILTDCDNYSGKNTWLQRLSFFRGGMQATHTHILQSVYIYKYIYRHIYSICKDVKDTEFFVIYQLCLYICVCVYKFFFCLPIKVPDGKCLEAFRKFIKQHMYVRICTRIPPPPNIYLLPWMSSRGEQRSEMFEDYVEPKEVAKCSPMTRVSMIINRIGLELDGPIVRNIKQKKSYCSRRESILQERLSAVSSTTRVSQQVGIAFTSRWYKSEAQI